LELAFKDLRRSMHSCARKRPNKEEKICKNVTDEGRSSRSQHLFLKYLRSLALCSVGLL
jgi:hypothetical protein